MDAIRDCFRTSGFQKKHDEQEHGGLFLIGIKGRLFWIDADYQVGEPAEEYAAVGCGDAVALGALHATRGKSPQSRILTALEAAAAHSPGVRGPFTVRSSR